VKTTADNQHLLVAVLPLGFCFAFISGFSFLNKNCNFNAQFLCCLLSGICFTANAAQG